MSTAHEGTVSFRGIPHLVSGVGKLSASGGKLPLLVYHYGPGFPHDYPEDLAILADARRPVDSMISSAARNPIHPDDPCPDSASLTTVR
jgi:hypothetical protein